MARSTFSHFNARSSPRRKPAYKAVAHTARSASPGMAAASGRTLRRGEVLLCAPSVGETLIRMARPASLVSEDVTSEDPVLPRVFDDLDVPPRFSFVNPLIAECSGFRPNPAGPRYLELAHAYLHHLWAEGDTRVSPSTPTP